MKFLICVYYPVAIKPTNKHKHLIIIFCPVVRVF